MKYIVESIGMHRMVHVIEAESPDAAMEIARSADDNWQEYLGEVKVDIAEFTPERIKHFQEKTIFGKEFHLRMKMVLFATSIRMAK